MECLLVARHVRAAFEPTPHAPCRARRLVRDVLVACSPDLVLDVGLAVSELVANSVEHTNTRVTVAVTLRCNGAVLVEVSDEEPGWGSMTRIADHLGGRGLGIVATVADRWDVRSTPIGKTVWAWFGAPSRTVERPLMSI